MRIDTIAAGNDTTLDRQCGAAWLVVLRRGPGSWVEVPDAPRMRAVAGLVLTNPDPRRSPWKTYRAAGPLVVALGRPGEIPPQNATGGAPLRTLLYDRNIYTTGQVGGPLWGGFIASGESAVFRPVAAEQALYTDGRQHDTWWDDAQGVEIVAANSRVGAGALRVAAAFDRDAPGCTFAEKEPFALLSNQVLAGATAAGATGARYVVPAPLPRILLVALVQDMSEGGGIALSNIPPSRLRIEAF